MSKYAILLLVKEEWKAGHASEIAGETQLIIRAFDGIKLDSLKPGIEKAFAKFEAEGISEKDLNQKLICAKKNQSLILEYIMQKNLPIYLKSKPTWNIFSFCLNLQYWNV